VGWGGNYAPDLVFEGWRPVVSETRNAWLWITTNSPKPYCIPPTLCPKRIPSCWGAAAAPGLIVKTGYLGYLGFFSVAEIIFVVIEVIQVINFLKFSRQLK
jgi:hypothetical protein